MKCFERTGHTVIWGNCVEALREFVPDSSIDLIFADPPYNLGKSYNGRRERWQSTESYLNWCKVWLDLCVAKLKATGSLYLMNSTQNMPYIDLYVRERMTVLSRVVWHYDSSGVQAKAYFGSLYEPILYAVKDEQNYTFNANAVAVEARTGAIRRLVDYRKPTPTLYNSKKVPGNVWSFSRVRYRMPEYEDHPTQKPETLLRRIISASSNPGDIVLDPFAGTFTTCAVAKELGRTSIGIEVEEEYVKIGLRRLQIADAYNGQPLQKPARSFELARKPPQQLRFIASDKRQCSKHSKKS